MTTDHQMRGPAAEPHEATARQAEPLDPQIRSIQPGGGVCMRFELAWGRVRRWYLSTFRQGYLQRIQNLRVGSKGDYPHPILDPRDLKYYRNQGDLGWESRHDPFAWRDRLPFARVGLAELILLGGGSLMATVMCLIWFWPAALLPALVLAELVWFFRDPAREVPPEPGLVVAPADGKVVAIEQVEHDAYIGGPAVTIGIFLSIFNVHINRAPVAARVIGMTYRPGKFLNALRAASVRENEALEVRLEESVWPFRPLKVVQIAGAIARRIVCWVRPGEHLRRGAKFGMIKLGSRTELTLPVEEGMEIVARIGQHVRAGSTLMVRYQVNDR